MYKLITIWNDDAIQAHLKGCRKNSDVYRKIVKELTEAGHNRTLEQCRDKMKKLKTKYKRIKDKQNEMGQGHYLEWDFSMLWITRWGISLPLSYQ